MADIGGTLREARIRAKIDINEVEGRTKIRAKYLRALENEEWDLLPGDVYVRSFLRTYGDFLGLDSRQLIDDFKRRYEPPDHELRPISPRSRDRDPQRRRPGLRIPPWAVIGMVLVGVVVALYFVGRKPSSSPSTANTPAVSTQALTTHHHARSHHHAATGTSVRRRHAKPTTVRLQLVPTGAVWVCAVDGSGRSLIPGRIYDVGQAIPVTSAPKMLITLGNASVKMTVNGHSVPLAPSSSAIGYELTPRGESQLPPAQQPRCA